ncbi:aromatic acid/H+ symport family MFS transporter [Lampropedia puyangensis]|uniref:Aromatic acid/H+ symport family MFS transporter n=1 Tax=Lampropedia puyangensis TaxID=1330072 RepID=A0A4S8F051_9BURK|nr:MFS transporter [Lampropedia puyangensis]THU00613.1 aromatic acid/H+ symport family MFS transporter [Lampropedia puyangensis]
MVSLSHAPSPLSSPSATGTRWLIVALCAAIMMVEGFDLLIYSNAIPSLLMDASMGLDKAKAGNIGSMIFIGMLLGGVAAGQITQSLGLSRSIRYGFALFTLATAAIAFVTNGWQLGALRLIAGLGLGVVLPAGLSLARRNSKPQHGALAISLVMSGIPVGGMLAAIVSQWIIPHWGWRPLFVAGGALGLLVLVVMTPLLSRHEHTLTSHANQATAASNVEWRHILRGASRTILLIGTLATLADLLTWYGVAVWLTQLMFEFDVPFNGAMQMMFTLNVGAIAGSIFTASIAMRLGTRPVAIAAGIIAAMCLAAIASRHLSSSVLFIVIALLGMSAISAQNLVNALVADAFPAAYRAAAIGITLGMGRLGAVIAPSLGGYILAGGHGPAWVLQAFAIAAMVGAGALLFLTPALSKRSLQALENTTARRS